jgi:hypothetical protein
MYTSKSEAGAEKEGRQTRSGSSSMKIGTYTKDWYIYDVFTRQIQPEGFPDPVTQFNFKVKVTSFVPLVLLGDEIKRYETVGWWLCSYQEILRHLHLGSLFTGSSLWKSIMNVIESQADDIYDMLLGYYDRILRSGDDSDGQWEFYVKEHENSAAPFEDVKYWKDIRSSIRMMNASKDITMKWESQFNNHMHKRKKNSFNVHEPYMIKASYTYPGFRARPSDYTIVPQASNDYTRLVLCSKWRDRKVGGIPGLSQSTWRIFKNKSKDKIESYLTSCCKKLSGLEVTRLSEEKLDGYLDILNNDWHLYDMKTAEKQTGLAFQWTGFTCDLGHPKYPAELASEMYSGIGPTSPLNEFMCNIILRVLTEDEGWEGRKVKIFSDNLATDVELPDQVFLEKADQFCGLDPIKKSFAPVSMCTDGPKHRISFNGKIQRQTQTLQYVMRPLLACIMNGIGGRDVTQRFLEWCKDKEVFVEESGGDRKDYLVDEVLRQPEIHKDIRQDFNEVETFVKKYFYVQMTDSDFTSNLRVT